MTKLFGDNNFSDFADRKQLATDGTRFCIEGVKKVTQKDGKERWYCTIFLPKDGGLVEQTLTFDRSTARDQAFQGMIDSGSFPLHSVRVEMRTFKAKNGLMQSFYQLDFDDKAASCPCGDLDRAAAKAAEPADTEAADLVETPF